MVEIGLEIWLIYCKYVCKKLIVILLDKMSIVFKIVLIIKVNWLIKWIVG